MGEMRSAYKFWLESLLKGGGQSEDLGIEWGDNIKWILGKWGWRVWTGFVWLRIGTGGGFL
jgi:hypothetical protein